MSVQTTQWEPVAKESIQLKGGLKYCSVVGPLSGMPESLGLSPSRMSKETIATNTLGKAVAFFQVGPGKRVGRW